MNRKLTDRVVIMKLEEISSRELATMIFCGKKDICTKRVESGKCKIDNSLTSSIEEVCQRCFFDWLNEDD